MNSFTNPYVRLQIYYSWLSSRCSEGLYTGMTIQELQSATQIPISVIRMDIASILKWNFDIIEKYCKIPELENATESIENMIYFSTDEDKIKEVSPTLKKWIFAQNLDVFSPELKDKILAGELDHIPLFISHSCYSEFDIALTYDEALALDTTLQDLKNNQPVARKSSCFLKIKDNYRSIHNYRELADRLQLIEEAIEYQTPLFMKYKNAKVECSQFHFQPLKISYDETENLYCVLSVYHGAVQVHRLDRIQGLWSSKESVEIGNISIIEDLAPQVWGNCFSEEPQHVKVKFYNEANVWNKVKKDLACRTKGQLYEKDGFLYYEDTVYGISKFRPWIYSFGSSAIVLEPKSLREHIIDSLLTRKAELT